MDQVFVYVTAESVEEARRMGWEVVARRLAACVNILPGMQSFYWWDGALQEGSEAVLVAKTRAELAPALTAAIRELHAYECPCVVVLPIVGGNPDFLAWIEAETRALPAG